MNQSTTEWNPIGTPEVTSSTLDSWKLTARYVETVKLAATRRDIRDDRVRGLILRVGPSGQKTWCVLYRRRGDGQRRRYTIGRYPAFSLEEARNEARQIIAAIARGEDPAATVQRRRDALTFDQLVEIYFDRFARHNKAMTVQYDDRLKLAKDVLPAIGSLRLEEITKGEILTIVNTIVDRGSGVTANRTLALVKAILNWGVAEDLTKVNPAASIRARVEEMPRDRVLTDDELRQVWHGLDHAAMTRNLVLAMRLSIVTGQRIGAIIGMKRSELDLSSDSPVWTLRGNRTKNRELTRVPLSPLALDLVRQALELSSDQSAVFPSPKGDGPMRSKAATRAMTRSRRNFGVDHFTTHDFRRTCASGMARLGIPPFTVSLVLDHISATKGTVTGAVYVKYSYDREKRAALDLWAGHVESLISEHDRSSGLAA